jgi:hypothetical protein
MVWLRVINRRVDENKSRRHKSICARRTWSRRLLVPMLRVGMQTRTLCAPQPRPDAPRRDAVLHALRAINSSYPRGCRLHMPQEVRHEPKSLQFGEAQYPHFITCTIVGWQPIFTRPGRAARHRNREAQVFWPASLLVRPVRLIPRRFGVGGRNRAENQASKTCNAAGLVPGVHGTEAGRCR